MTFCAYLMHRLHLRPTIIFASFSACVIIITLIFFNNEIKPHKILKNIPITVLKNLENKEQCPIALAENAKFQPLPIYNFPGSGVTLLRQLLEQATGFATTGTNENENTLSQEFMEKFIGEIYPPLQGNTIAFGINSFKETYETDYCVFLMRKPIDVFISEFQHSVKHNRSDFISLKEFQSNYKTLFRVQVEHDYLINYVKNYKDVVIKSCKKGVHVLFFENLLMHPEPEMKRLIDFVEVVNGEKIDFRKKCLSFIRYNSPFKRNYDKHNRIDRNSARKTIRVHPKDKFNENLKNLNNSLNSIIPNDYLL